MVKKAFQQGRSERRGEAYSLPYVEPLSDARTTLEDFFNILLAGVAYVCDTRKSPDSPPPRKRLRIGTPEGLNHGLQY
jgi:hypothetical protein